MKVIVCEMCQGQEFTKQDGLFVCGNCGTKYSVEEAQKLMVEVEGGASSNKKLANLYERARKSLEVDDLEHAAEYYKQILDEDPKDWEAYFYSYLGEFTSFTNGQAGGVAAKLANTIPPAFDMAAASGEKDEVERRVKEICEKATERLTIIGATGKAMVQEYEGGNILTPGGKVHYDLYNGMRATAQSAVVNAVLAFDPLVEKVEALYSEGKIGEEARKECLLTMLRVKFNIANMTFRPSSATTEKMIKDEAIQEYARKVKELDPSFEIPAPQSNSSGGCYVATAVYGSYDCPQVWTLRRYRDDTLAETWYGRAFIKTYYAISPTLVKWFGHTEWFKKLWKGKLDRMVSNLQAEGVESTPYEDREW